MIEATHLSTADIAARLGVATATVTKWIARYADTDTPFPAADVIIRHRGGLVRGWARARWPEIHAWTSARTEVIGS